MVRLVREDNGAWRELDRAQVEAIIADLDQPFDVAVVDGDVDRQIKDETGAVTGSIRFNKARIALRRLDRPLLSGIFVEDAALGVGQDPERQPFVRHLDAPTWTGRRYRPWTVRKCGRSSTPYFRQTVTAKPNRTQSGARFCDWWSRPSNGARSRPATWMGWNGCGWRDPDKRDEPWGFVLSVRGDMRDEPDACPGCPPRPGAYPVQFR